MRMYGKYVVYHRVEHANGPVGLPPPPPCCIPFALHDDAPLCEHIPPRFTNLHALICTFNSVELTFKLKKQMMLDVASGMQYLHGQNPVIIHRDLKSLNVLIDENWVTKVI